MEPASHRGSQRGNRYDPVAMSINTPSSLLEQHVLCGTVAEHLHVVRLQQSALESRLIQAPTVPVTILGLRPGCCMQAVEWDQCANASVFLRL